MHVLFSHTENSTPASEVVLQARTRLSPYALLTGEIHLSLNSLHNLLL